MSVYETAQKSRGGIPSHTELTPQKLLEQGISTERLENIPIYSIELEAVLTDPDHVASLQESMAGKRGQISPITVRAREGDTIIYDVIDGFHRAEALVGLARETGQTITAKSVVVYGCSDEELFDLRVLAANSVRSVKFARMAQWMQRSFQSTQWANGQIRKLIKKGDITIAQVFSLAQLDTPGSKLGLMSQEADELKEWARKKAKQWNRPISSLVEELRTVEVAAPDLVNQVRAGGGGHEGRGVLTHARLKAIVTYLPGEWELQREVVQLVLRYNFIADEVSRLAFLIGNTHKDGDERKLRLILQDPILFIGEKEYSRPGHGLSQVPLDREKGKRDVAEVPAETIYTYHDLQKSETFGTLKERLKVYEEIIRKQGQRIGALEAQVRSPSTEGERNDNTIQTLLQREWGAITYDTRTDEVGCEALGYVRLSRTEGPIFRELLRYSGTPLDAKAFILLINKGVYVPNDDQTLATHINRIKGKFSTLSPLLAEKLENVSGRGYMWR